MNKSIGVNLQNIICQKIEIKESRGTKKMDDHQQSVKNKEGSEMWKMTLKLQYIKNKSMWRRNKQIFDTLISRLQQNNKYQHAIINGLKQYQIKQFNISQLTPHSITQMYQILVSRFYYQNESIQKQSWHENELRIFIWVLLGYAHIQNKHISELGQRDWEFFSVLFNNRKTYIFQFQTKAILKNNNRFSQWHSEQISIFETLMKTKVIKNKWNQIAKEMYELSNKTYFRTPKQCREFWISRLNPQIIRAPWALTEDLQLIQAILKHGKKWSKVSKEFENRRTQHMVKNRFKSLYRSQCKKNHHIDGQSNDDIIIRQIKERIHESLNKLQQSKNVEISKNNQILPNKDEKNDYSFGPKDQLNPRKISMHHFLEEDQEQYKVIIQKEDNSVEDSLNQHLREFSTQSYMQTFFSDHCLFQL